MSVNIEKVLRAREYLILCAQNKIKPTYTKFGRTVGNGQARHNGDLLMAISDHCAKRDEPDLHLLVVAKGTELPTVTNGWRGDYVADIEAYKASIAAEQERCFQYNWPSH
jgi:hypothetical protein